MELHELLSKYKQLPLVERMLSTQGNAVHSFLIIKKEKVKEKLCYFVEPTPLFYRCTGAISSGIVLNPKLRLLRSECGCLEYYRKKECVHTTILYALAMKMLNYDEFERQVDLYKQGKIAEEHGIILNKLADDLRTNGSFFNKIHLAVEINNDGDNYLSLRIGYDKEYIIKSISEFVSNMEQNKFYSYGQKLAFVHSYEVLDDESKEFYSFLLNISHEDSLKSIKVRRNHFLRILEIFHNSGIYYYSSGKKSRFYPIVDVEKIDLVLNAKTLFIDKPKDSKELICGVNYAYFIAEDKIYAYRFKKRNEAIIFNALFKMDEKGLMIEANSTDFISNLLPVLKAEVEIDESFYEQYSLPSVSIDSYFVYQNGTILLEPTIKVDEVYRNTPYVSQVLDGYYKYLEAYGFVKNDKKMYYLNTAESQYQFLTADLSTLKSFGDVFFDESIKNITLKKSNKVNIAVSYNVGLLDFKLEAGTLTIDEIQAMLAAYHQKKKFVKLKNDVIIKIEEMDVKKLDDFLEDFNIDIADLTGEISKPLNYILKLVGARDDSIDLDDKICEMIDKIQNYKDVLVLPAEHFMEKLRPYQVDAFKWLKTLSEFGFGGILADDMGLGKTIEILSFLSSDEVSAPTLIVCPMSLVYNWENECKKWDFQEPIVLVLGTAQDREDIIKNIDYHKKSIYITSYDSLRRDVELYTETFRFIIADEAQYIKNQNALKSTAIKQLKSMMNYALTGTPIENGLADLWSIFDYLMPGYLANYNHFKSRYESLIMQDDTEALDLLKKRVKPFILRRTKKDVLKELPDKIEEVYYCKMEAKQAEIYNAYVEQLKQDIKTNGNQILALITRLRQVCITPELIYAEEVASAKVALAIELIKRAIAAGHRILLFSQFSTVFNIFKKLFEAEGISYQVLDGTTKAQKRLELVEEFNRNEEMSVFMISLKAGGTGLNLVGADMVIHLDPWWNVSAENQATDRAYRFGQKKNVHVLKLVCKDTIEEKVLLLQQAKLELANSIIHSGETKDFKLRKEDILQLLD